MNTTAVEGEVITPKKVAFVDRKSANSDRIEQDEKELKELLEDEQANIRWDAAIALAKMGNNSGVYIIEGLLDREFLNKFKEIDPVEEKRVLMVAIKTASILFDKRFEDELNSLSKNEKDLSVRNAAIKALEKYYNNGTN